MIKQRNDNLTKNEELELGRKIQEMKSIKVRENYDFDELTPEERGIVLDGEEALEILTGNYINLARDIAHKHHKRTGTRYDIDDLLQDAIGALIEAAHDYDPSKNCRLSTYAFYGITKKVSTTINYQRLVRMPENKMGEYVQITKAQKEYNDMTEEQRSKYTSELDYIYQAVGNIKKEEVDLILENMQPQVSLNAEIYDGEGQLMDILEDENSETQFQQVEALDEGVERIINELTPFQRDLIAYEFEVFPASMPYSEFLKTYNMTDKKVKSETRKTITLMANIAKRKKITVAM